jgi:hypothetical protein
MTETTPSPLGNVITIDDDAKIEPNPAVQRDFFDMERRWLKLARGYQYLEQLSSFTAENQQLRASLSERLKQLDDQIRAQPPSGEDGRCPANVLLPALTRAADTLWPCATVPRPRHGSCWRVPHRRRSPPTRPVP